MINKDIAALPGHIAIIMDGNGRWAKGKLMERFRGHEKGADVVRDTVTECRELGIKALSLYAFSVENWARPKKEVSLLMHLLERFLKKERKTIMKNNIRLTASGRLEQLPAYVKKLLFPLMSDSESNDGMILNLCISYGGKEELIDATRAIAVKVKRGDFKVSEITPEIFEQHLYVPELPPVDLMIRTSGEVRTSGFLPWQILYAELSFPKAFWPEFTKEHLYQSIADYQNRERRFGHTSEQLTK